MLNLTSPTLRDAPCDLCGRQDFHRIAERDRRGHPLPTDICRTCGLVSHSVIPTDEELARYYVHRYRQSYHGEYFPAPHRIVREWNRAQKRLRLLRPFLHRSDRVIEIGCGMGATVKQLELAGFAAEGIEPGNGFRQFGTEHLRAHIHMGTLADLPRTPTYDFVLLFHVLEHLNSPTVSLEHIHRLLKPGGRLFIEVPNAGAPHAAPGRMFHFAHVYNFTADTLRMLAEKNRFRVRQWLSAPEDKNLRLLVEPWSTSSWQIDPGAYDRARSAVAGQNPLRYYFRGRYFRQRLIR